MDHKNSNCTAIFGQFRRRFTNTGREQVEEHLAIVLDRTGAATLVQVILILSIATVAIVAIKEVMGRRRPSTAQMRAIRYRLLSCVTIITTVVTLTAIVTYGQRELQIANTGDF